MAEYTRELDVSQGFNFKQDEHASFGYLTGLVIGDTNFGPDFKVADPLDMPDPPKKAAGSAGEGSGDTSGMFKKPAVAVLTNVSWTSQPTDPIKIEGRITAANYQLIAQLTMLSMKKIVLQFAFVVFDYDTVNNTYFPSITTYKGSGPVGLAPSKIEEVGFGKDKALEAIFGVVGKEGNAFQLTANHKPEEDVPGFVNHAFTLAVVPTAGKESQQLRIQTSAKYKIILPWGLPKL